MNNAVNEVTDCELDDWGPVSKKREEKHSIPWWGPPRIQTATNCNFSDQLCMLLGGTPHKVL